jgi:CRISPR-associated protein Cas1
MSTLYLDRRGLSLKLEGRSLALYLDRERQSTVPLHLLERVVMRSSVEIDSSLLARLTDRGIGIMIFGGRGASKQAVVLGRPGNDGARRIGQYARYGDPSWRRAWSRRLVLGKLKGQISLLRRALDGRPDLRRALTLGLDQLRRARERILGEPALSVDSLRGVEGAAAAAYFETYGHMLPDSLGFNGRNRRPPRDPVNAVLSLGYTLLHFEAVRACHASGLDPMIGFFHDLDFGRESLACDLIEPLRPRLDAWAWEQFRQRTLRADDFRHEGDACLLGKSARQKFYGTFELFARPMRRLLRRFSVRLARSLADVGSHVRSDQQEES